MIPFRVELRNLFVVFSFREFIEELMFNVDLKTWREQLCLQHVGWAQETAFISIVI